jgi:hypothetical protein
LSGPDLRGAYNRKDVLYYPNEVFVTLADNRFEIIGMCRVFTDEKGRHFGELHLDKEVSLDLYFYYRSAANNGGIFVFTGLDLMQNQLEHSPTTKLKDMIVS